MQKKYKTILFDLDNTLVDDDENRKYAIKQILLQRNENTSEEVLNKFVKMDDQFWKDRAEGKIIDPYEFETNEEKTKWIRSLRFVRFFKDISIDEAWDINIKYVNYLSEHIVPKINSKQILKYLYEKGYEIYIITNGPTKAVNNKLKKIGVLEYITDFFTAEEAGHMKPRKEFFDKFFEKINKQKTDDMLIIGDEIEKDVAGGINNGIDSCWLNYNQIQNDTEFKPTFEIKDLLELKNIL